MKTPLSRRIFFWTLFVSYFVTTGIVLFFVFGYRHDFREKIFVYTGSLTLKTNPKSVSIKLNNKEPKSRLVNVINDSYFITGLKPGQYKISVTTDEFKQWVKDINIHSGISTELWNIVLIRNNYERIRFNIKDIDKFFPAPQENIFATTSQLGKTLIVYIFDTKANETINSFIFPKTTFTNNNYENIEWSPDGKNLIIPVILNNTKNPKQSDYFFASKKNSDTILLSDITQDNNIQSVRWDPEKKNGIYFISNNTLYAAEIDIQKGTLNPVIIQKDVLSYDFADDGLYILSSDGNIIYSTDKKNISNTKTLTKFEMHSPKDAFRLIAYDNRRVVLINDSTHEFYSYNKGEKNIYTTKLADNIIGAHFSDDGKKLLFYSPFEIFVHFTRDSKAQPVHFENQTQSIIRFAQSLNNVHFAKDYEHVIYTIGNEIKMTELDYRGNRITDTIILLNENKTIVINKDKMNRLFFLDSTNNTKRQLQAIEFPEKETLF